MNKTKKISLVVMIVFVIASIWYLEMIKVHSSSTDQPGQTLNVDRVSSNVAALTSSTVASSVNSGKSGVATMGQPSVSSREKSALAVIAATDKASGYKPAIEIQGPTGFINVSSTFKLGDLIGKKVVLLDFWTYSCINCVRTIPYLNAWYQKYASQGLVIVGIHTPEFAFEKNINNVQAAVKEYGIQYPVILDSNQGTWNAYNNLYWPHEYLIDLAGYIVHDQVGEGGYTETEASIQKLLAQRATLLGNSPVTIVTSTVTIPAANLNEINSPETYFGATRNSLLSNGTYFVNGNQTLILPADIAGNRLYLGGIWDFEDEYAKNISTGAQIKYEYNAKNVYIVASGAPTGTTVEIIQDGKAISAADAGTDVHDGKITIGANKLYNLVNNSDGGSTHVLELIVDQPGLQAYTFTFG